MQNYTPREAAIVGAKKYYTIGDISDICNVPIKTLRYYDEIQLLVGVAHTAEQFLGTGQTGHRALPAHGMDIV